MFSDCATVTINHTTSSAIYRMFVRQNGDKDVNPMGEKHPVDWLSGVLRYHHWSRVTATHVLVPNIVIGPRLLYQTFTDFDLLLPVNF